MINHKERKERKGDSFLKMKSQMKVSTGRVLTPPPMECARPRAQQCGKHSPAVIFQPAGNVLACCARGRAHSDRTGILACGLRRRPRRQSPELAPRRLRHKWRRL